MSELLELTVRTDGDVTTVAVKGELDLTSVGELRSTVEQALDAGRSVRLSLAQLQFIDSTGLSALVELDEAAARASTRLVLADVPDHAARLLHITKLDEVLSVES